MSLTVRPATPADLESVVEFNLGLAKESEGMALDRSLLRAGVAAGLADPDKARYFIAVEGGQAVGQIMITYEWSDWRNGWFWWIQSVYVRPEARRQGVFRALYQHVADCARQDPAVIGLRLYVEKDNHAAQKTYLQMGMQWTAYQVLERYPL
jgi:GNAT superfamily N-acetyltransferase